MAGKPSEEQILFPNAELEIGGDQVTVREFGFMESLKLEPLATPIIDALAGIAQDWESVTEKEVLYVIAEHDLAYAKLIAASIDRPLEFVQGLDDADGMAVASTFWRVNQGFFVRRLLRKILPKAIQQAKASAGQVSSPR